MGSEICIGSLNSWVMVIGIGCLGINCICSVWNWFGNIIFVWLMMLVGWIWFKMVFVFGILVFRIVVDSGL